MDLMTPATATKMDDVMSSEFLARARAYGRNAYSTGFETFSPN